MSKKTSPAPRSEEPRGGAETSKHMKKYRVPRVGVEPTFETLSGEERQYRTFSGLPNEQFAMIKQTRHHGAVAIVNSPLKRTYYL